MQRIGVLGSGKALKWIIWALSKNMRLYDLQGFSANLSSGLRCLFWRHFASLYYGSDIFQ